MAAPVSPLVTARYLLRPSARRIACLLPTRAAALRRAYIAQADEKTVPSAATDANARALLVCSGPLEHYDFLIKQEELRNDEQQRRVVQHLQKLHESLKGYSISSKNLLSKLFAKNKPPKGLYVYGDVGTGKTMVMDMFYSHLEVERKKRVHFHGFMLDVHQRIHRLKQSLPKRKPGFMAKTYDPIAPVAEEISGEAALLCFDEFQMQLDVCGVMFDSSQCVLSVDTSPSVGGREMSHEPWDVAQALPTEEDSQLPEVLQKALNLVQETFCLK